MARLKMNHGIHAALIESRTKVRALIAATRSDAIVGNGEDATTTCALFEHRPGLGDEFTQAQKDRIRMYVESWISFPLETAISAIEGANDFETERNLESFKTGLWR